MTTGPEEPDLEVPEPPAEVPPEKLEYMTVVYGWLLHVHREIDQVQALMDNENWPAAVNRVNHIDDTFEEALRDLALYIPEEARETSVRRASSRAESMLSHPLPPFPGRPGS